MERVRPPQLAQARWVVGNGSVTGCVEETDQTLNTEMSAFDAVDDILHPAAYPVRVCRQQLTAVLRRSQLVHVPLRP